MPITDIVEDLRKKVSLSVTFEPEGENTFRVFTPFTFDDGDHLGGYRCRCY